MRKGNLRLWLDLLAWSAEAEPHKLLNAVHVTRGDDELFTGVRATVTKTPRTVSEKLGFWEDAAGQPRRAYRARIPLRCAGCSGSISPGDVFARRSRGSKGSPQMQVVPYCGRCLPLRPPDSRGAGGERREDGG